MENLNTELTELMVSEDVTDVVEEIATEGVSKGFSLGKGLGVMALLTLGGLVVYKKVIKPKRDAKKALNDYSDDCFDDDDFEEDDSIVKFPEEETK